MKVILKSNRGFKINKKNLERWYKRKSGVEPIGREDITT